MRAILERDFFQFAKHVRYFVIRSIAVGLPVLLLGMVVLATNLRTDQMGQLVFQATIWPIMVIAAMFSPAMVAPILVEERQNNRLEVLRSTPLSAAEIVLGRWLSRVALVWSMIIAALPLTAASLLFGGVDPNDFYVAAAIVMLTVPMVSSIALCVSAGGGDSGVVLRITYGVVLVLLLLPMFMMGPAQVLGGRGSATWVDRVFANLALLDPVVALGASLSTSARAPGVYVTHPLLVFTVFSLVMTAVLVAWSIYRVTQPAQRRRSTAAEEPRLAASPDGALTAQPPVTKRKGRFSAGLSQLWRNPPLWLELRRSSSRAGRLRRIFFWVAIPVLEICLVIALIDEHAKGRDTAGLHIAPMILSFLFCVFAIATSGATAVHRDGQANTLDVLHSSPLENGLLAAAKVGAALRAGLMWFLFGVAHITLGVLLGDIHVVTGVACVILVVGMLFSLAGFSVRYGMTATTLNRASSRVMGVVVSHLFLSPVIGGLAAAALGMGEGFAFFLGHHPLWIVGLPLVVQEGGMEIVGTAFFWLPLAYFVGFLCLGIQTTFHSIPLIYGQMRDDTRVSDYERS